MQKGEIIAFVFLLSLFMTVHLRPLAPCDVTGTYTGTLADIYKHFLQHRALDTALYFYIKV